MDEENQQHLKDKNPKKEKKGNKKTKKREDRQDIRKHKDYELFLRDLEDDPELR